MVKSVKKLLSETPIRQNPYQCADILYMEWQICSDLPQTLEKLVYTTMVVYLTDSKLASRSLTETCGHKIKEPTW